MKVKPISLIILGLCILSIFIGVLNTGKEQEMQRPCPAQKSPGFFKSFSSVEKIALITLDGVISKSERDGFIKDFSSAESVLKSLNKAHDDDSVKGVIFRINSPGGTVAMSQEIYNAILRLREEKPVIVSMADLAASGGYYVASAADRIYANPGTLTGSIGVIMEAINARGLLTDKLGIESQIIKSGKYKDVGNIYRPLSQDERELLENLVNNAYNQFLNAIVEGRINRNDEYKVEKVELTEENLKKYADGRIFSGEQALEYGFVDKLGGLAEAEDGIKKIVRLKDIPVVEYNKPRGIEDLFLQISERFFPGLAGIEQFIPVSRRYPRQPLFIWE